MDTLVDTWNLTWLVVEPTHLKNMSQIGSSPQPGDENKKYLSCHHPVTNDKWETHHEDSYLLLKKYVISILSC